MAGVLIRGVRWEETYERAQALLGDVPYPAWHPFYRYARSAFTVQYYLSAGVLWLTRSAAAVCGLRQVLFLGATVLPPYLLAARVSRRTVGGHVGAVLAISGVIGAFGSYYPLFAWPDKFTSGHIGMGAVLVALYLIVSGHLRSGLFLAGLMPAIHVGQAPVLMVVAGLYAAWRWVEEPGSRGRVLWALGWGAGGLAVSGAVWLSIRAAIGPGGVLPDGETLHAWRQYVFVEDIHRAFARFNPPSHGFIALGIAVFLGVFGSTGGNVREKLRDPVSWLGAYAAIIGAVVLSIAAIEHALGPETQPALVVWMPKRLLNHTAVLALAMATGLIASPSATRRGRAPQSVQKVVVETAKERGQTRFFAKLLAKKPVSPRFSLRLASSSIDSPTLPAGGGEHSSAFLLFGLALCWLIATPTAALVLPAEFHTRYAEAHEGILFLLSGGASAVLYRRQRRRLPFATCLVAGTAAIAAYHQFGAALIAAGFVLGWGAPAAAVLRPRVKPAAVLAGLCAIVLAMALAGQWRTRAHLPVNAFEASVRDYLDAHAAPGEFLLIPHWEIDWQEKTNHPVLYTYELPQHIVYMPALAPDILKMRADIYDIRLGLPWDYGLDAWRGRSREEWRRLGGEYGFGHVLSPNGVPLDLEKVLPGEGYDLYAVN